MKGHTKIELTDVNTGEVETYEDDNMVTKALDYFLAPAGPYSANGGLTEATVTNYPLWQTYVGGLLLFDSALDENVENVLPNAAATMVGNGAYGVTNNADPTELGSYNENESGVQEDGSIRMVWDFTTSQANGTIACACLTSRSGGYIGAGNESGKYVNSTAAVNSQSLSKRLIDGIAFNQTILDVGNDNFTYACVLFLDYGENVMYYIKPETIVYTDATADKHWTNTGYITIVECRYPLTSVDLHYNLGKEFPALSPEPQILKEYNVPVPDEVKTYMYSSGLADLNMWQISRNGDDAYILFYATSGGVAAGSVFYVLKLHKELDSFDAQLFAVTNTTGSKIACSSYYIANWFFVNSGQKLFIKDSASTNWFGIDLTNPVDVSIVEVGESTTGFFIVEDKIYTVTGFIDTKTNKYKVVNGNHVATDLVIFIPIIGNSLLFFYKPKSAEMRIARNCQYLATINNLEEPVVKNASKTMKVTYTLTF